MNEDRRALTPAQARAARALLGWTQREFSTRAGVAEATVTQFERGNRMPSRAIAWAMRVALENAGVELIAHGAMSPAGGEAPRLRPGARESSKDEHSLPSSP